MYYEQIRESGAHSVGWADTDQEVIEAAQVQHYRAIRGQLARPVGTSTPHPGTGQNDHPRDPAERIVAIHVYETDPGTTAVEAASTPEAMLAAVKDALKGHDKSTPLTADEVGQVMAAMTPQALVESDPHESNYTVSPVRSLDPSLWQAEPTPA